MRAPSLLVVVVLVSSSSSSCGLFGPTGAVSLCEATVRAQCELQFRCCEPEERQVAPYTNTEAECIERASGICKLQGTTDDSIGLGRTQFNADNANACLAALNEARDSCERGIAQRALACGEVFEGLVEGGDDCAASSECAGGGLCDFGDGADVDDELNALQGECVALPGDGEECLDGACATGLFCNAGNNECAQLPGEGDDCNFACARGLFCDQGACAPQKVDGEECAGNAECFSAFCLNDTCSGDNIDRCNGLE